MSPDEMEVSQLEAALNDFSPVTRQKALSGLGEMLRNGMIERGHGGNGHNLHCHTFFSYNGYGYSPSYIAWLAAKNGWFAAGIVDFDVLDAVDEFLAAARLLNLRGVAGIETRAFMPEFAEQVLNSPGEPGIAYHMGVGFTAGKVPAAARDFQNSLRRQANRRTEDIVNRVNPFLAPVKLDFTRDVLPLTPGGNATERHVCAAYFRKAEAVFPEESARIQFWSEKLQTPAEKIADLIGDRAKLEALIRSKTMKSGGPGYVKATPDAFPLLVKMNEFSRNCGAIPTIAWLDGGSDGEKDVDLLLDRHLAVGAAALNIIPDRNWNFADPEVSRKKVFELNRIIDAAKQRQLPIIVGTEMNAPGQKLMDDFNCEALKPHVDTFVDGAALMFAHTLLQPLSMGYLSDWAARQFADLAAKNRFFVALGRRAEPVQAGKIAQGMTPEQILALF